MFLAVGSLSKWARGDVRLSWDAGVAFCDLGYFSVGYVIRKRIGKSMKIAIVALSAGLGIEELNGLVNYGVHAVYADWHFQFDVVQPFAPLVVCLSVLIFIAFAAMDLRTSFVKISNLTFIMYLVHGGVARFTFKLLPRLYGARWTTTFDCLYWVWIIVAAIFIASLLSSLLYNAIFNRFNSKYDFIDKIINIVNCKVLLGRNIGHDLWYSDENNCHYLSRDSFAMLSCLTC